MNLKTYDCHQIVENEKTGNAEHKTVNLRGRGGSELFYPHKEIQRVLMDEHIDEGCSTIQLEVCRRRNCALVHHQREKH